MKPIKLKSILSEVILREDPDDVIFSVDDDGRVQSSLSFDEPDAYTFVVCNDYAFVGPTQDGTLGVVHERILEVLLEVVYDMVEGVHGGIDDVKSRFEDENISVTDIAAFYKDVLDDNSDVRKLYDVHIGEIDVREPDGFVTGRYWTDNMIISFWNSQKYVMKMWPGVEKMMREMKIANFADYSVEFPERDSAFNAGDTTILPDMILAKNVKKSGNQMPELTKQQYLDLLKKAHLSPPDEKKKILKQLGADVPSKASRIADKLGMTVAQFNHLTNVNENN